MSGPLPQVPSTSWVPYLRGQMLAPPSLVKYNADQSRPDCKGNPLKSSWPKGHHQISPRPGKAVANCLSATGLPQTQHPTISGIESANTRSGPA
jgi:hypothetical protein